MTDILSNAKRTLAWSVAFVVAAASLLALAPATAQAATQAGAPTLNCADRIQFAASDTYVLNCNMEKLPIANDEAHNTYWKDFNGIQPLDTKFFDAYPKPSQGPKMLMYRPGSRLVKLPASAKVYAITLGQVGQVGQKLRHIKDPSVAKALQGPDWQSEIRDISSLQMFAAFEKGAQLSQAIPYNGQVITTGNTQDTYFVMDGKAHMITGSIPNRLQDQVESVDQSVFNKLTMASKSVTPQEVIEMSLNSVLNQQGSDQDGDGVADSQDNCPATANANQADSDNDGTGDACEKSNDQDGDGVADIQDNCPATANPNQADSNNDGTGDACDSSTTSTAQGTLNVTLSANTPGEAVPKNATHVKYLEFNVEAKNKDVDLSEIEFKRYGLGNTSDFGDLWLETGGMPITGGRSLSSNGTINFNLSQTIKAGNTKTFSLVANMDSADTSRQNGFRIKSADMIKAGSAKVSGNFAISGNKMDYADYDVGQVTLEDKGSGTDVEVGSENEIVGEFDLEYTSGEDESDALVNYIRFEQSGSADLGDLKNIALYESGNKVSKSTNVSGDYVTFKLKDDKKMLGDGDTMNLEIRADIESGEDGDTIQFKLDDTRDVFVEEKQTGFGAEIKDSLGSSNLKQYTLDAGQFTMSLDSSNPGDETYAKGTEDVTALVGKTDLGQNVRADTVDVYFQDGVSGSLSETTTDGNDITTDGDSNNNEVEIIDHDIEQAELYMDGKKISTDSEVNVDSDSNDGDEQIDEPDGYHYEFSNSVEIKDDSKFKLKLDIDDDATTNTYAFELAAHDGTDSNQFNGREYFEDPEYINTGEELDCSGNDGNSTDNCNGVATGNNVEVSSADLTITRNDGYTSNEIFITGSSDQKLMQVNVSAGNDTPITLEKLDFDFSKIDEHTSQLSNLKLMIDGKQIGETESASDAGSEASVLFDNLDYTIDKGKSKNLSLVAGQIGTGIDNSDTTTITLNNNNKGSVIEDSTDNAISFSSETSATLEFQDNAELYVSLSGNTPDSALAVASGGQTIEVAQYDLEAKDGEIEVEEMYLGNDHDDDGSASSSFDSLVEEFQLVGPDGNVLDTDVPSNGFVKFENINSGALQVDNNKSETVSIKAKINQAGVEKVSKTGHRLGLGLYGLGGKTVGASDLTDSSVTTSDNNTDVDAADNESNLSSSTLANTFIGVQSAPKVTQSDSNTDGTLLNTDRKIFSFEVEAQNGSSISWKKVELDLSGSCANGTLGECLGATSSMEIRDGNGTVGATFSTSSNKLTIELDSAEKISGNSSETYTVEADLGSGSNFDTSDSSNDVLSVSIEEESSKPTDQSGEDTYSTIEGAQSLDSLIWSDNSGTDGNTGAAQWYDSVLVDGLDTNSHTLTP